MSKRVILFVGLVACVGSPSQADRPFGRYLQNLLPAPRTATAQPIPLHILKSPQAMTERFGESILIREPKKPSSTSKFVTQPD